MQGCTRHGFRFRIRKGCAPRERFAREGMTSPKMRSSREDNPMIKRGLTPPLVVLAAMVAAGSTLAQAQAPAQAPGQPAAAPTPPPSWQQGRSPVATDGMTKLAPVA